MKNLKDMLNESRQDIDKDIIKKAKDITKLVWYPEKCTEEDIQEMLLEMAKWMKGYTIEKACEWLEKYAARYAGLNTRDELVMDEDFCNDFCKAMEK